MNSKILFFFCVISLAIISGAQAQMKIEQVGPSAEKNGNTPVLSFSMLGKGLQLNDFVSLKKLRKQGAAFVLNYQMDLSRYKRLKPNEVTFKLTLLRDGTKLKKKTLKHAEKGTSLNLEEMLSEVDVDDSLIIEVLGLPLKSTEKVRTIVFRK